MPAPRSAAFLRAFAFVWLGLLAGFAIGVEFIRTREPAPDPSGGIDLVGAGATFPYPLYRQWFADYGRSSGVRINYFSVGSHEGIRLLLEGSVDFGATDRLLTPAELSRARCGPVQFPTVVGAVAVAYNLPGVNGPLRLDATTLQGIFTGRIARWDAPAIRALNPDLSLPPVPIRPVRRARVTGTAGVFARFVSSASTSTDPADHVGVAPATASVEGNEGVTAEVRATVGAIGAVEQSYADQARLPTAQLRNASGAFVAPSAASAAAAAEALLTPEVSDTISGLVGAMAPTAYPAVVVTRLVVDTALGDPVRGAHFLAFARWALTEGANSASDVGYAALPEAVRAHQIRRLRALQPGTCPSRATAP